MFENLVGQEASKYIISDIKKGIFPGAVLFSGNDASGKLTAALEVARVYSCMNKKGDWNCQCPSCLRQKALVSTNMLLMGPRECALEIAAARNTFLNAYKEKQSYLPATRYLYLRSIRKLTLRFSSVLYKGENNLNKIGALIDEINEQLEQLDFPRELPAFEELEKICNKANELSLKLESDYLYNSIPINQVRNMEEWAYIKSDEGKKTIIIENADRMQNNVRNALLKILEEPPADCIFILLTSRRNAVMQTILSRVRTYNFLDRNFKTQQEVINRVFHDESKDSISDYLKSYLPVSLSEINNYAEDFIHKLVNGKIPNISELVQNCNKFEPKIEFRLFLTELMSLKRKLLSTPQGCEASVEFVKAIQNCWDSVYSYNQNVQAALENLVREINRINVTYEKIITKSLK